MDYGHKQTEKELAALERKIAKIYSEASEELKSTIEEYFAKFEKRDKHQLELLNAGKITEDQYKQWRLAQIGRGERFKALQQKVAERYTEANKVAVSYVNNATPGVYSLNRNYAAYEIERVGANVDFALWDEQTVRRMIVEEPEVMPYYPPKKAVNRGIDLAWGKRQISASVTGGILQGKSIGKIATDLQSRMENMNRTSAIRTARTAMTGAQNAGRMDSYAAAEKMGIDLEKEWLATLDGRTRHQHRILDGQHTATDKPFEVEGQPIMFPGDPTAAPWLVYNCRCTLIARVKGVDTSDAVRRAIGPETGESVIVPDMTYKEWEKAKAASAAKERAKADEDALKFFSASGKDDLKSIVKRGTIKIQNGFACFPDGDPLNEYAKSVEPLKTFFDVAMHGTPTGVCFGSNQENMSARLLASVIRHSEGYTGQNVRLLSCSTGKKTGEETCLAEELANALGVVVKAPTDTLYITEKGGLKVGAGNTGTFVNYKPNERRRLK